MNIDDNLPSYNPQEKKVTFKSSGGGTDQKTIVVSAKTFGYFNAFKYYILKFFSWSPQKYLPLEVTKGGKKTKCLVKVADIAGRYGLTGASVRIAAKTNQLGTHILSKLNQVAKPPAVAPASSPPSVGRSSVSMVKEGPSLAAPPSSSVEEKKDELVLSKQVQATLRNMEQGMLNAGRSQDDITKRLGAVKKAIQVWERRDSLKSPTVGEGSSFEGRYVEHVQEGYSVLGLLVNGVITGLGTKISRGVEDQSGTFGTVSQWLGGSEKAPFEMAVKKESQSRSEGKKKLIQEQARNEVDFAKKVNPGRDQMGVMSPGRLFSYGNEIVVIYPFAKHGDLYNLRNKLDKNEKISSMYQVARGLKSLHEQDAVHRDIKPENILVDGECKQYKLTDFGVSKVRDPNMSYRYSKVGTPGTVKQAHVNALKDALKKGEIEKAIEIEKAQDVTALCVAYIMLMTDSEAYNYDDLVDDHYAAKKGASPAVTVTDLTDCDLSQKTARLIMRGLNDNWKRVPKVDEVVDALQIEFKKVDFDLYNKITEMYSK